jgi:hypothetical protein
VKRTNKYLRIQTISGALYLQLPLFLPDQLTLGSIHPTVLKKAVTRHLSVLGAGTKIIKKNTKEDCG